MICLLPLFFENVKFIEAKKRKKLDQEKITLKTVEISVFNLGYFHKSKGSDQVEV